MAVPAALSSLTWLQRGQASGVTRCRAAHVTGVWKKMTEEMMTTTRFTQLPIEGVTGVTRDRIM